MISLEERRLSSFLFEVLVTYYTSLAFSGNLNTKWEKDKYAFSTLETLLVTQQSSVPS